MIVTLDGEQLDGLGSAEQTLQALIDRVRAEHLGERLVVSVACDGEPVVGDELTQRLGQPLGDVERVDLASANRRDLVVDALREVAGRLEAAQANYAETARDFHAGKMTEAITGFAEFLTAWQLCQRVLLECSTLLGEDLTAVECAGQPVRDHLNELADKLRELRDAFESRDAVLLSDFIQYELPEICDRWQRVMAQLADHVQSGPQQPST